MQIKLQKQYHLLLEISNNFLFRELLLFTALFIRITISSVIIKIKISPAVQIKFTLDSTIFDPFIYEKFSGKVSSQLYTIQTGWL